MEVKRRKHARDLTCLDFEIVFLLASNKPENIDKRLCLLATTLAVVISLRSMEWRVYIGDIRCDRVQLYSNTYQCVPSDCNIR